jgi:hypothetical protein
MIQRMISWARAGSPQPARVTNTPLEKSLVSVNDALHMGLVTLLSGRGMILHLSNCMKWEPLTQWTMRRCGCDQNPDTHVQMWCTQMTSRDEETILHTQHVCGCCIDLQAVNLGGA